jgi:hypothetical protein
VPFYDVTILLKLLSRALLDIAETLAINSAPAKILRKQAARLSVTALLPHAVHVTVIQAFEYAVAAALPPRLPHYSPYLLISCQTESSPYSTVPYHFTSFVL